jgi:hypothetical protein
MTRRVLVSIAAAVALACGSSSSSNGGGTGTSVSVGTGPYSGTYTNGAGVSASGSCSIQGFGLTGSVVSAGLSSSAANLCQALAAGAEPANAVTLTVSVAKLNIAGQAQTITPGTYTVVDLNGGALPQVDTSGNASLALVSASKSGGSAGAGQGCALVSADDAASGTVIIGSVSTSRVSGTVNATLKNGAGIVNGAFDVPLCSGAFTVGGTNTCAIGGIPSPTSCQ